MSSKTNVTAFYRGMNATTAEQQSAMFDIQQRLDDYIDLLVAYAEWLWEEIRKANSSNGDISHSMLTEVRDIDRLLSWHKNDRDDENSLVLLKTVLYHIYRITQTKMSEAISKDIIDADSACRYVREMARFKSEIDYAEELRQSIWNSSVGVR